MSHPGTHITTLSGYLFKLQLSLFVYFFIYHYMFSVRKDPESYSHYLRHMTVNVGGLIMVWKEGWLLAEIP